MPKVHVPSKAGDEIVIRHAGNDPITYKVTDGTTTVKDGDLDVFLASVEGSKVEGGKSSTTAKES